MSQVIKISDFKARKYQESVKEIVRDIDAQIEEALIYGVDFGFNPPVVWIGGNHEEN